jgi:predicted dehydrogenase
MNRTAKIILIGCGPHAKRVYLPALKKNDQVELMLIVDLKIKESEIRVNSNMFPDVHYIFIDQFQDKISHELGQELTSFVLKNKINGVIIATDPLVHKPYALWAVEQQLNILLDKPVSARKNVVSDIEEATGLVSDFQELSELYLHLQANCETIFMVNSQRRFHKGFDFVKSKIKEVAIKSNCPVTFISAYHSDGQWRFPSEIVTQDYHPYCFGYGKGSHSGYHIFDTVHQLYESSQIDQKLADNFQVSTSFVTPKGLLGQLNECDYDSLFGSEYSRVKKFSDNELQGIFDGFGEVDISAILRLKIKDTCVANISINLLHNGFAGRTWITPGIDLYKGNGRIKHEYYNIQQGPFQNIQIHSYQSEDVHDFAEGKQFGLGENNHFDVYVFRNPLIALNSKRLEVYSYEEILVEDKCQGGKIVMEDIKYNIVSDFIDYITGIKTKEKIKSQITEHLIPVQIMSSIYQSHILQKSITSPYGLQKENSIFE